MWHLFCCCCCCYVFLHSKDSGYIRFKSDRWLSDTVCLRWSSRMCQSSVRLIPYLFLSKVLWRTVGRGSKKWHIFSVLQITHGKYWWEVPIIVPLNRAGSLIVCYKSLLQFVHPFLILQQKECIFLPLKTQVQLDFLFGTRDSPRHCILISSQISLRVVNWVIDVYQEGLQRPRSS